MDETLKKALFKEIFGILLRQFCLLILKMAPRLFVKRYIESIGSHIEAGPNDQNIDKKRKIIE